MQALPLSRQPQGQLLSLFEGNGAGGEDELDLFLAAQLVVATAGRQGRHRLEAPFLVWDAAKGVVAVVDDLALPARLLLLPLGPFLGRPGGAAVDVAAVRGGRGDVQALRVHEGAPRRHGEEEEAHPGPAARARAGDSSMSLGYAD